MALTRTRMLAAVVVAVTALSAASGCSEPSTGPVPTPSASESSPKQSSPSSPTRTASPTPDAKTQRARREVLTLVEKYYKVDEAIATNSKVPLKRYYEVADGDGSSADAVTLYTDGSWLQQVVAGMLIMAGDGLDYDELVEWSRVGVSAG